MKKVYVLFAVASVVLLSTDVDAHSMSASSGRYQSEICSGTPRALHWNHPGTVPIYVNTSGPNGVQHLKRPNGAFWGTTDIVEMVKIAIGEFNNASGVGLRLTFAGTTSSTDIVGAIVFNSSGIANQYNGQAYRSYTCAATPFAGRITAATIYFNRVNSSGGDRFFSGINDSAGFGVDMMGLFNHELGHTLGLAHSDDALVYDSGGHLYDPTMALMYFGGSSRHWTKYERDTLLDAYGYRYGVYLPFQSGSVRGYGDSWNVTVPAGPQTTLSRGGGKISEQSSRAVLGWLDWNSPEIRMANRLTPNSYYNFSNALSSSRGSSPPAVAFGDGQFRVYWVERGVAVTMADGHTAEYGSGPLTAFNQKRIFWMSSSDGVNWTTPSALLDPSTSSEIRIVTDDVSANYDPARKVFIVTWLDAFYNARYMTVPAPTSSQSGNYYGTFASLTYWETPSIACSSSECVVVGAARNTSANSLLQHRRTNRATISATGAMTLTNTVNETGFPLGLPPSLAYVPWDGKYLMSYTGRDGQTLYVTKATVGSAWPTANLIALYGGNALSPPAVGTWLCGGCGGHVMIGIVKYGP